MLVARQRVGQVAGVNKSETKRRSHNKLKWKKMRIISKRASQRMEQQLIGEARVCHSRMCEVSFES